MAFCGNCGTATAPGQAFCTVCGHRLQFITPAPALALPTSTPARVITGLAPRAPRQSRWSVLFRGVLLVPLGLWYFVVSFASFFVIIAAWFSALFIARVPAGMQRFLTDVLRYQSKVGAYAALLSAHWPGMNLRAQPRDQISLEIDHVALNRWAVFFRFVLMFPATVVSDLMSIGAVAMTFVMWCSALVAGRCPQFLHEARGLMWRYKLRTSAYVSLLTPTQPFEGFFGDPPVVAVPVDGAGDDDATGASTLSTTWPLAGAGKVAFIVALLLGSFFQLQPGLLRWPVSQVVDRGIGRHLVSSQFHTALDDLSRYQAPGTACLAPPGVKGGCYLSAAAAATDVKVVEFNLTSFQPFVVRGSREYSAFLADVVDLKETLTQLSNWSSATGPTVLVARYEEQLNALTPLYQALYSAI